MKAESHLSGFVWTISNFDFHERSANNVVISPEFKSPTNDQITCSLFLKPNGKVFAKENTISLHLYLHSSSPEKVYVTFEAFVLNNRGEKTSLKRAHAQPFVASAFRTEINTWGWTNFLTKDEYFRTTLLCNGDLRIHVKVLYCTVRDVLIDSWYKSSLESNANECNLGENLASLLDTQAFSDVVVSANGKNFPAHKVILAARSKVFAAMFQHDTKENQLNRVAIENMSGGVVEQMLRFMYTGKCEKVHKMAEELLAAADKYDLDRLKLISSKALYRRLSPINASRILILADMYNANDLKHDVIEFIASKASDVLSSPGWNDILSKPQLVHEVCQALTHRATSDLLETL